MSVSPQVGDVVRLTIATVTEGEVWKDPRGCLRVCSYYVYPNDPGRTVEILERATPPLPSEPGTYWLDRENDLWVVDADGKLSCVFNDDANPAPFAPFRQLVVAK